MVGNAIAVLLGLLLTLYGVLLIIDPNSLYVRLGPRARWERRLGRLLERHIPFAVRRACGVWLSRVGGVFALLLGGYICIAATSELIG